MADDGIAALDAGHELRIENHRVLRDRHVLASLSPGLARLLPRSLARLAERKWLGRGVLREAGRPRDTGWVIHEVASWQSGSAAS